MKLNNFIEIDIVTIEQIKLDNFLFLGKIKFKELDMIHKLTERKESDCDPFDEKKEKSIKEEDEEFQRRLNQNKLGKIAKYLGDHFEEIVSGKEKASGIFHTSLILALKYDFDYEPEKLDNKFLEGKYSNELDSCFISKDKTKLFIPKNDRIALIVDGQHRFYGLKRFYESLDEKNKEMIDNFEFQTTFLIGLDTYEVGQVFATVNFTQKPVNRSLYYDIFGSVPDIKRNEIKLAHDLALHLNNNEDSPIKDMIKMLGEGYGLFSQAFFVRRMLSLFKGVWKEIYKDYLTYGKRYKEIPEFMKIYLGCIESTYSFAWPIKIEREGKSVYSSFGYNYILCKTTGLGAFFKLIRDIYPIVGNLPKPEMKKKIIKIFKKIPEKEAKKIFSKDGDFGGAGSEGLVNKFYRFLKTKLDLDN